jgi:hypothetical protein
VIPAGQMFATEEIEIHGLGWVAFRRKTVESKNLELQRDARIKLEVFVAQGVGVVKRETMIKNWGTKGSGNRHKVRQLHNIKKSHRTKVL